MGIVYFAMFCYTHTKGGRIMAVVNFFKKDEKVIDLQAVKSAAVKKAALSAGFNDVDDVIGMYFSKTLLQPVHFLINPSTMRVTLPIKTEAETVDAMLKEEEELLAFFGEGWYGSGSSGKHYSFSYKTRSVQKFTEQLEKAIKALVENNKIIFEE